MKMKNFIFVFVAALLLCGCSDRMFTPEFLLDDSVRIESGKYVFSYNPLTCQMAFNRGRKEFRVHTDSMSDYFRLVLDRFPTGENEEVTATLLEWTTGTGTNTRKNVTLKAVKLEGDTIWLWYADESVRMTVRYL